MLLAVAILYSLAGTSQYDNIVAAIEMLARDEKVIVELLVLALL